MRLKLTRNPDDDYLMRLVTELEEYAQPRQHRNFDYEPDIKQLKDGERFTVEKDGKVYLGVRHGKSLRYLTLRDTLEEKVK